jgi:aminopeptidase
VSFGDASASPEPSAAGVAEGYGAGMDAATVGRYARLVVEFGANVQPGQIVLVRSSIGREAGVRAVAKAAYQRGARFVDVSYFDPYVKRERLLHAAEGTLDFVPSWYGEAFLSASEQNCANIALVGPPVRGLYADIDPARVVRDELPMLKEMPAAFNRRTMNMCIAPWPDLEWARLVHPYLEDAAALARLTEQIVQMLRLDQVNPVAAWEERLSTLNSVCERLNDHRFDALHFLGPGTDLTVGLLSGSRWVTGDEVSAKGIRFIRNLPTEEVFTTPDPERVEGLVSATRPFSFGASQTIVEGLTIRFEHGRAVAVDATRGAEQLQAWMQTDTGASRLGEVALVDNAGRIEPLGTAFYHTLIDENAGSHLALGFGFDFALDAESRRRRNQSGVHNDFTIGSRDLMVTGIQANGRTVPVMDHGNWQI